LIPENNSLIPVLTSAIFLHSTKGFTGRKNGEKYLFQIFFEAFLSDDVDDPSQIVVST
jgi:hypothetical protein